MTIMRDESDHGATLHPWMDQLTQSAHGLSRGIERE
jgi:hypothetical protein